MEIENNKKNNLCKEFGIIYEKEIAPILKEEELRRKNKARKFIFCYIFFYLLITTGLAIPFWIVGMFERECFFSVISILASSLGVFIIIWLQISRCEKRFIVELKKKCLPEILKYFGQISWCNNEKIISDDELNASGLFAVYNQRVVDDEFKGSYSGVDFKICETDMRYVTGGGRNRNVIPVFRGVVFSFDLNKAIQNRTIVSTKGDLTQKNEIWMYMLPAISFVYIFMEKENLSNWIIWFAFFVMICVAFIQYYSRLKKTKPLNKVNLEDPKFSKKFDVYSSDQIEARFWITPAFMERFQNLKTAFNSKKAKCSFYDNKIMIAIDTNKNVFEIGEMYKSLENPEAVQEFCKEISSINELIDYFKIHEKVL